VVEGKPVRTVHAHLDEAVEVIVGVLRTLERDRTNFETCRSLLRAGEAIKEAQNALGIPQRVMHHVRGVSHTA
jgi:hypothetical protein